MTEKMSTIEEAKTVIDMLTGKIKRLRIEESNLEAQIHQRKIAVESSDKLKELEILQKYQGEDKRLKLIEDKLKGKEDLITRLEEHLDKRKRDIEERELELSEINTERDKIGRERDNFNAYRVQITKDLELAKITIAEANASKEEIEQLNHALEGRKIKIEEQEKWWNDRVGELEVREKALEIREQNEPKEVVHV